MPTQKTEAQFINELWSIVVGAAKDVLTEGDVKAAVRDQVEYAARTQFVIATTSDAAIRELAQSEFAHLTAQIEAQLAKVVLDATKRSRLVGILEGVFNVLLKYAPVILSKF